MSEPSMIEDIRLWLPVVSLVISGVIGWIGYTLRKAFVSHQQCADCRKGVVKDFQADTKEITDDVDDLGERVTRNENDLANQPTNKDVTTLNLTLKELGGDIAVLSERITGVKEAQVSTKELALRLDSYLRRKG